MEIFDEYWFTSYLVIKPKKTFPPRVSSLRLGDTFVTSAGWDSSTLTCWRSTTPSWPHLIILTVTPFPGLTTKLEREGKGFTAHY